MGRTLRSALRLRSCATLATAVSKSSSLLAFSTLSFTPSVRAAVCMSLMIASVPGKVGFTSSASTVALGTSSCRNSKRFPSSAVLNWVTPVTLPPGRFRAATRPSLTGSMPPENTIGMVEVAALAASAAGGALATITVTGRRTNSDASAGIRSYRPSAQRYSIATFRLSMNPISLRPRRKCRYEIRGWIG